ncbi:MAG: HIT family protein [Candidatus Micrarchaeota archaeon]|nr:HIT family protein [Candidatus Micrarchaeota archaeon]
MTEFDPFCSREAFGKTVFFESRHFMALYDINPVVRGHILLVPRRHVTDPLQLTAEESDDSRKAMRRVVPRILDIYDASEGSYNMTMQVGPYSGRSISHIHMHIIPRNRSDPYHGKGLGIYKDIERNVPRFGWDEVSREIKMLRKEFKYGAGRQTQE